MRDSFPNFTFCYILADDTTPLLECEKSLVAAISVSVTAIIITAMVSIMATYWCVKRSSSQPTTTNLDLASAARSGDNNIYSDDEIPAEEYEISVYTNVGHRGIPTPADYESPQCIRNSIAQ